MLKLALVSAVSSLCFLHPLPTCTGLSPPPSALFTRAVSSPRHSHARRPVSRHAPSTRLQNDRGGGRNAFDMSKPTFDLFSFRLVRADALQRYNNLNQSEPLRVNLFLFAAITLVGYPLWCESVTGEVAATLSTAGATLAGFGSAALFWRERARRSKQLNRMEKELNAETLEVRVPVNTAISSVRPVARLKDLRSKRRIIAIRGSKEQLAGSVSNTLCVLGRRLRQSQTLVVLVPTDGSNPKKDWGWDAKQLGDALWLAEPLNVDGQGGWINYFKELLSNDEGGSSDDLAWFALNFKGRSIASGLGEAPRVLELLGQQLQPMSLLDETDEAVFPGDVPAAKQVLACQKQFYGVLTDSSDGNKMQPIFSNTPAEEVSEVLGGGGRIDDWTKCLEPDARPVGMVISGADVWLASDTVAYSTCIEFPPNAGIDGATLLAVQRWGRSGTGDEEWKLELHQTIPWNTGTRAGGTLRCDCRGCVALASAQEKRTFGGLIG